MSRLIPFVLLTISLASCSDKYVAYKSNYAFSAPDGVPEYKSLNYWAAHPWKKDPSDSLPQALKEEKRDSVADVFFVHPTSYTDKSQKNQLNARVDDDYLNARTDYSTILYQASVFNRQCRVFAPRYRQAHISNFFSPDTINALRAFELAYADIREAFLFYLENWNQGRPIIIAGHSQGSKLAELLLKEFFESKPLAKQLVVAYVPGWSVPPDYFTSLEMCKDSLQTGCVCSWRTFRNGYHPAYLENEKGNSLVTNPISWTTTGETASKKLNKGSVLFKFNKVYKHTTDAKILNGLLYVSRPRFPWGFLYFSKNYHIGDYNLFYMNIRDNIDQRFRSFQHKRLK